MSGDPDAAMELYRWNIDVSSAFYAPLHFLEVGLRNAQHRRLVGQFGQEDWWHAATLTGRGPGMVDAAVRTAAARANRPSVPDDVVTELHLGFWVSLVSRSYDRSLWVPSLHAAFPHHRGRRKDLHGELETMRLFRNRIMHHEPVHHRHLEKDHETALRLVGYMSPELVRELEAFDRVPRLLAQRPPRPGERR
jgi:hypothetical protein